MSQKHLKISIELYLEFRYEIHRLALRNIKHSHCLGSRFLALSRHQQDFAIGINTHNMDTEGVSYDPWCIIKPRVQWLDER